MTTAKDYEEFCKLVKRLHRYYRDLSKLAALKGSESNNTTDGYLTANQIANLVWKLGDSAHTSLTVGLMSQYFQYFERVGSAPHQKFRPKWELIIRDHPNLFAATVSSIKPKEGSDTFVSQFCSEGIKAIEDEYYAACDSLKSNPVYIIAYQLLEIKEGEKDKYFYEGTLYYELDENPPIPEGVIVKIWWPKLQTVLDSKLLAWDFANNKVIVVVNRLLVPQELNGLSKLQATVQELIKMLAENLHRIASQPDLLCWKIIQNKCPDLVDHQEPAPPKILDESQAAALRHAVANDFTIIWGPPGTGKTYTIGHLLCQLLLQGKTVLATSIANVAVDNMALAFVKVLEQHYRSLEDDLKSGRFLRHGYTKREEVLEHQELFPIVAASDELRKRIKELKRRKGLVKKGDTHTLAVLNDLISDCEKELKDLVKMYLSSAKVIFTTVAQVSAESLLQESESFDVVVVDEASMMSTPAFVISASRAKTQVVAVGDYKQLAPVAVSKSERALNFMHKSIFELLGIDTTGKHPAMKMIDRQRRMNPEISKCISTSFYKGGLRDSESLRHKVLNLPHREKGSLIFHNLAESLYRDDRYMAVLTQSHSRYNLCSVDYVFKVAQRLCLLNPEASIAIITPYRQQAHLIRKKVEESKGPLIKNTRIGTVHTFQGSEADIVIWDLVDTREKGFGRLYQHETGDRLTNVAISRARHLLVVVGDRRIIYDGSGYRNINKLSSIIKTYFPEDFNYDSWLGVMEKK